MSYLCAERRFIEYINYLPDRTLESGQFSLVNFYIYLRKRDIGEKPNSIGYMRNIHYNNRVLAPKVTDAVTNHIKDLELIFDRNGNAVYIYLKSLIESRRWIAALQLETHSQDKIQNVEQSNLFMLIIRLVRFLKSYLSRFYLREFCNQSLFYYEENRITRSIQENILTCT